MELKIKPVNASRRPRCLLHELKKYMRNNNFIETSLITRRSKRKKSIQNTLFPNKHKESLSIFDYTFETMDEQQYFKKIQDVLIYDCEICNQTWFKIDVIEKKFNNVSKVNCICQKCRKELDNDKISNLQFESELGVIENFPE